MRRACPSASRTSRGTFGQTSREAIATLWGGRNLSEAHIAAMDAEKEEAFRRIIRSDVPLMPGAAATAISSKGRLPAGRRIDPAPPENVDLVLDGASLRELFQAVVTGADVTGKPDPQVFELAARRLGVPPARCVVIEDAPAGAGGSRRSGHDRHRTGQHRPEPASCSPRPTWSSTPWPAFARVAAQANRPSVGNALRSVPGQLRRTFSPSRCGTPRRAFPTNRNR